MDSRTFGSDGVSSDTASIPVVMPGTSSAVGVEDYEINAGQLSLRRGDVAELVRQIFEFGLSYSTEPEVFSRVRAVAAAGTASQMHLYESAGELTLPTGSPTAPVH